MADHDDVSSGESLGPDAETSDPSAPRARQRFAKGRRPFFMRDPDVDRLLAIITALTAEVWVGRERLDTVERLAAKGLPGTPANIEAYQAEPDVETAREALRAAMLDRVFRILSQPLDGVGDGAADEALIARFA